MHLEIQVALNFLISFLYNKLPRRRVNQFGEELEAALKIKFAAHWYPGQPAKGSAYRCLKTTTPLDPVYEVAARNCGLQLSDIQTFLPAEMCIWIDPGEVSYRMSEKGPVKLLYQESSGSSGVSIAAAQQQMQSQSHAQPQPILAQQTQQQPTTSQLHHLHQQQQQQQQASQLDMQLNAMLMSNGVSPHSMRDQLNSPFIESNLDLLLNDVAQSNDLLVDDCSHSVSLDSEVGGRKVRSFNPDAQCFKPDSLSLPYSAASCSASSVGNPLGAYNSNNSSGSNATFAVKPSSLSSASSASGSSLLNAGFTAAKSNQVTMTTAQFAQTKFGSTKLKNSGASSSTNGSLVCGINGSGNKRNYSNRMSPTEFSAYIKQRSLLQQNQNQSNTLAMEAGMNGTTINSSPLPINSNHCYGMHNGHSTGNHSNMMNVSVRDSSSHNSNRSLSSSFGNFTAASPNAHLLALSPQPSRSISPISPPTKGFASSPSQIDSLGYLMIGSSTSQSTVDPFASMFAENTSSLLSSSLTGNDNVSMSNEMNYLSDLLGTTSLSPVLGNSGGSLNTKSGPGPIGSRLNQIMMNTATGNNQTSSSGNMNQSKLDSDLFGSAANSFLHFGDYVDCSMADSSTSFLHGNSSLQMNHGGQNTNLGSAISTGLQLDCNQNSMSTSVLDSTSGVGRKIGSGAEHNNNDNNSAPPNNHSSDSQSSSNASQVSEDGSLDSFSITLNGVTYPNQYQHLLVAN